MKIETGKKFKKKDLEMNIQTMRCGGCHEWLKLILGSRNIIIDDISIQLQNFPLLECRNCSSIYLPDKSKGIILYFLGEAEKRNKKRMIINPYIDKIRSVRKKQLKLYKKTNFKYDSIDYEYIPGLMRRWNDGYLTPVFFEKDVLLRYYNKPNYLVTFGSDTYGTINIPGHIISFGINRNEKVIMWLGEIVVLPKSEQKYLLAHNKISDHEIGSEFYEGQIEIKFTDFTKEMKVINTLNKLSETAIKKWNIKLLKLDEEAISILKDIKQPIFYTKKETGKVLEAFNKFLIERIDSKKIKSDLRENFGINSNDLKDLGSLKIFQRWLEERCNSKNINKIISPLFVLNDFRKIFDHILSKEKEKATLELCLKRLSLSGRVNDKKIYETLLNKISNCYQQIVKEIEKV